MIDDFAHALQFFIEFAAPHGLVFFPPVMRKQVRADISGERGSSYEHPGLHHQLSQTDTAQKGRFTALVGAGNNHELFMLSTEIVSYDFRPVAPSQTDIIYFSE